MIASKKRDEIKNIFHTKEKNNNVYTSKWKDRQTDRERYAV